jgi:cytochrome c-type biogenesis protein CcmH/NrfG
MPDSVKSRHRFGEFVFLGALIVVTLVVYNLIAWSKTSQEQPEMQIAAPTPTTAGDFVQLGNDFMDRGLWDHAIRQYEQSLELDSRQPNVLVDLGACYHAAGDHGAALAKLHLALDQSPQHQVALFNLGVVHISRADTVAAKTAWNQFLEVAGDSPQADAVRQQLEEL